MPRLTKLHIVTFGCQMSAADAEELARPLRARGLTTVGSPREADAIIVNTCTVRQHAEDRAVSYIGRLRPWKAERPEGLLIVAGCAAERVGAYIRRKFPYVDLVVGARSTEDYPRIVEEALKRRYDWREENHNAWPRGRSSGASVPQAAVERPPISAYLTIMRGCDYSCSYCIVPSVRGRELHRPFDTVLAEAGRLAAAGARELTLLGQTVNGWRSQGRDFADLLRAVAAVDGVERVRFMSPHPHHLSPRLIGAMAGTRGICPYLHLPVQSGSDRVLRSMRRNYSSEEFLDRVGALREAVAGIEITTDFLVGFPGESERDFEATVELAERLDAAAAYCFKFSARKGTDAASFEGQVPEEVIVRRHRRLLDLCEERRRAHLQAQVGRRVEVLLEDERHGHTEHFFSARLDKPGKPGTLVRATVVATAQAGVSARTDPDSA